EILRQIRGYRPIDRWHASRFKGGGAIRPEASGRIELDLPGWVLVSVDALLRKYFVAVVLGLVALTAYFQAAGFSQLVGSALAPQPAAESAAPLSARLPPFERPKATAILGRNPFDSVTGPLVGPSVELPEVPKAVEVHEPLSAPACDGVKVFIVTESDDPLWSFAALQGPGESHPSLRRVGDAVGDRKVAYIGYNPLEASPSVWLEG